MITPKSDVVKIKIDVNEERMPRAETVINAMILHAAMHFDSGIHLSVIKDDKGVIFDLAITHVREFLKAKLQKAGYAVSEYKYAPGPQSDNCLTGLVVEWDNDDK